MGLLGPAQPAGRKPRPAYELPMTNVAGPSRRRSSIMGALRSLSITGPSSGDIDEDGFRRPSVSGAQQQTFLGRKFSQPLVPAFLRTAKLQVAAQQRKPSAMRMGESDQAAEDMMKDTFYQSRLTLDEKSEQSGSEDDLDEKWVSKKEKMKAQVAKRKAKGKWNVGLEWEKESLVRDKEKRASAQRKRRSKRVTRALDCDLDAFNTFARNGLTPSTRSVVTSRNASHTSLVASSLRFQFEEKDSLYALPDDDSDRVRSVLVGDGYDALDVMADHIFRVGCQKKQWFRTPRLNGKRDEVATGVSLRVKTGLYRTFPVACEGLEEFEDAVTRLNPEAALKIKSDIVSDLMRTYITPTPGMTELIIDANTRIQILDEIEHLARARKHQYAAFIRSEACLCVWADHVEAVVPAAEALEEALIQFLWRGEEENKKINQAMRVQEELEADEEWAAEQLHADLTVMAGDAEDVVKRKIKRHWKERPVQLLAPLTDGLAIMTGMGLIALGLRTLVAEWAMDGKVARFGFMALAPIVFSISCFACLCLVGSFAQTFGPIRHVNANSIYYSGLAPRRTMGELAHVTVQMPVYKEDLDEVIKPTIASLKRAITTYERQGGSVGILICDDGLQLLPKDEADRRRAFYFDNNIAYVARPGHNVDGFIRKGRFKKAGNMNFANGLSLRVEEILDDLRPGAMEAQGKTPFLGQPVTVEGEDEAEFPFWSEADENALYEVALKQGLEERKGTAWAAGNIRIGEIILIIDSDTRVPEDCFADAVSEMAESPEVAIIQHMSGVMQVAHHFFENGIAHFTRGIQHAISYCTASGEVAPFVGHNAFLRWSALQECLRIDPDDGVMKIWSEDHVSEDFQIAVMLQMKGYVVRWASYSKGEFEEGVSLTCDDELNRWQKYAFGCSELVLYPIKKWFRHGPMAPLYKQFLWSNIPLHCKFTISSYIFSYYAIGCSWFLTILNYFLKGWAVPVDGYYLGSWQITFACICLFIGLCNVSFITLRYRLKQPDAAKVAFDQLKWIPFFSIFFTGMSLPLSAALIAHPLGYNMTWSSTVKTVEKSNFFLQLPIIWRRFRTALIVFTTMCIAMIVLSQGFVPMAWRITNPEVFIPMSLIAGSHLLWPFALNPWFLSFSF